MFAAIFDTAGGPVDRQRLGLDQGGPCNVKEVAANVVLLTAPEMAATAETFLELSAAGGMVGRLRLDRRGDLQARLGLSGAPSDVGLAIAAQQRWGDTCPEHLEGDFSFVAFDGSCGELLAARDRMGVRALFHTNVGSVWLIGDSLDWLARQRSALGAGDELDDFWIGDFLTCGFSREFDRTVWRDIRRLPPAHCLRLGRSGATQRRYWRLDIGEPLFLRHRAEYGERFRAVVREAIADRLPPGKVGISMSGGLDSTTLAALAAETAGEPSRVVAECNHFERLMTIGEDRYARLAARHIGIELTIRPIDDSVYDARWRDRGIQSDEPTTMLLDAHYLRIAGREKAARAAVWFEGEGPDNALAFERAPYLAWLKRRRSWLRLGGAWLQYAAVKGATGWRQSLQRHLLPRSPDMGRPSLPDWLNRDFVETLNLKQRIETLGIGGDPSHPWHPEAMSIFTSPAWQHYLGEFDFQDSLAPTLHRDPYLDTRVLEFMLSVPPIPWGWKKHLVREAMRGRLPGEVLAREKTPLTLYPDVAVAKRVGMAPLSAPDLVRPYVDLARLPTLDAPETLAAGVFAVHALDHWMASRAGSLRPPAN